MLWKDETMGSVKVFGYTKQDSSKEVKRVFMMNSNETYLQGFDLDRLSPTEEKELRRSLASHVVHDKYVTANNGSPNPIKNVDSEKIKKWIDKAWRTYKWENITDKAIGKEWGYTKKQICDYVAIQKLASFYNVPFLYESQKKSIQRNINAVILGRNGKHKRKTAYGLKFKKNKNNELYYIFTN